MYQTYQNPYMTAIQPNFQQQYNPTAPTVAQQNQNVLPPQQVPQIDGKESIAQLRMSPNSSVLLMEKKRAVVWLCTSDGLGNITPTPYDITLHQDTPPVDVDSLEQRVSHIEQILSKFDGGGDNGKSDVRTTQPVQNGGSVGESQTD